MDKKLNEYWQELAKNAGISEERAKAVAEALGDEAVAKAFQQGFVARPDYSRDLDKTRDEWKGKADAAQKYYDETLVPAYKQYQTASERLKQYETLYGQLDPGATNAERTAAAAQTGMTKEELAQVLNDRENQLGGKFASLLKDVTRISVNHYNQFKEELDLDALEKFAVEKGLPVAQAYKEFVSPKVESARNAEFEAKLKAAREEGARDYASKHQMPIDNRPRDPHPIFDRKPQPEGVSDAQVQRNAHAAFVEEWNKANSVA